VDDIVQSAWAGRTSSWEQNLIKLREKGRKGEEKKRERGREKERTKENERQKSANIDQT
jgi:hypothetical protein